MSEAGRFGERSALIVVRADAFDRYGVLQNAFGSEGVEVIWDRRVADRRHAGWDAPDAPDRRRRERRRRPPQTWALLDFLVVPASARPA